MQAMNAVIYARYSSDKQTEQSIEGQLRDCREYAKRENLTVTHEYIDRAMSGRSDDRPDFQRMIADARKKQFQRIIVWKLDRFTRNRYDSAIYKYRLKQCGVRVLSAMENIGEGDESIILEAVLEASAEYYSRDLSKKVKRGMRETAIKGGFLGGKCPVGYKSVNGNIVIDEETAPSVAYAFEQYAEGTPGRKIIAALKGWTFTEKNLHKTLKNAKYTGEYTTCRDADGNGVIMTNYPAIISKELFDRVQARLKAKAHAPATAKAKVEYILQGKAYCGMCGSRLIGDSGTGKSGAKYYYYACGQKKRLHTCKKINEKKDFIEWYVVEQTLDYVLTPGRIDIIAAAVVAEYDKEFNTDAVKDLERRIAKLGKEIKNAVNFLISSGEMSLLKPTEERVAELTAQKEDLEIDLAKLQIASEIRYTVEDIKSWLKQVCSGDIMDMDFRQKIIDVFINSIYLYDDKIVIFYNVRNGKQVSYIDIAEALPDEADETEADGANEQGELNSVRISPPKGHHYAPYTNWRK